MSCDDLFGSYSTEQAAEVASEEVKVPEQESKVDPIVDEPQVSVVWLHVLHDSC